MVRVGPRDAVTRPCAGCALPWNASFMTIPSSGDYRGSTLRFELQLEPATLGPRAGGFAVEGAIAGVVCSWGGEDFGQAGTWTAGCGPFTRAANYLPSADIRRVLLRRISACRQDALRRPECRRDTPQHPSQPSQPTRLCERRTRWPFARVPRPGEPRMRVGAGRPCLSAGEGLSRCAPARPPLVVDRSPIR
jgi:hypothetical protein